MRLTTLKTTNFCFVDFLRPHYRLHLDCPLISGSGCQPPQDGPYPRDRQRPGLRRLRVRPDAGNLQQSQRIHFRRQTDRHGPVRPDVNAMRRSDDRLQRRQRVEGVRVPRQNVSRPAAAMTGRGTSLKAHQLVGSQLKTWQVDFEHLLGCRVEGQHADQRRRVRLVRRRRSHLHREEHSSGRARRDATGVAVQELAARR
jgi:hypothetical protein